MTKGPYYFEIGNAVPYLQWTEAEFPGNKSFGFSVRCVRDAENGGTFNCGTSTVKDNDYDNNNIEYTTVEIGTQCWMAENLRSTKYSSNQTGMPTLTLTTNADYTTNKAYYGYPDNDNGNVGTYGLLYNWYAVMGGSMLEGVQGICPDGWHVPTQSEFTTMISSANAGDAAGKLAGGESGIWTVNHSDKTPGNYDYGGRNTSGFSALPAGNFNDGLYQHIHSYSYFWTSTGVSSPTGNANYMKLTYSSITPTITGGDKFYGMSVRCVKDADGGGGEEPVEPNGPTYSQITFTPGVSSFTCSVTITGLNFNNSNSSNQGSFKVYYSTSSDPGEWELAYSSGNFLVNEDPWTSSPFGIDDCGSLYFRIVIKNIDGKETEYVSEDAIDISC